jgi:glutamate 5-kinase
MQAKDYLSGIVVIKYGTNAVTCLDSQHNVLGLNLPRIHSIAGIFSALFEQGVKPILVSSGAASAEMGYEKLAQRPTDPDELQDLCTDGQLHLFNAYYDALKSYGLGLRGPLLVTHNNFRNEAERANLMKRVVRGFANRKIPVFNTNDAVTNEELVPHDYYGFTDNDPASAFIAIYCKANSLLMVSEPGELGSGKGESKQRAIGIAQSKGLKTWIGTHSQLEELVKQAF